MLRTLPCQTSETLARRQLGLAHKLAEQISLTTDDLRRALDLTDREWLAWSQFLAGGRQPARPLLSEMLLRTARVCFSLSLVAEQHGVAA